MTQRYNVLKLDGAWWVEPMPFTPSIGIRGPYATWETAMAEVRRLSNDIGRSVSLDHGNTQRKKEGSELVSILCVSTGTGCVETPRGPSLRGNAT